MSARLWHELRVVLVGTPKHGTSDPPFLLKYRSSTTFILLTVCLAIFTDILYYALLVPVIPFSLSVQVGISENEVQQWTAILLACYNVSLFIGSPLAGLYADHTSSRRLPLVLGLLALAGSTLLLCLGKTIALLIVGRLLQGLSAAIVWSVGLALLADTMGRNIGYALGYVSIAMSVGLLISPVIGGAVYASLGYYAVYYIAFGVICCDILMRLVLIEKKVARQWITGKDNRDNAASNARLASATDANPKEEPQRCSDPTEDKPPAATHDLATTHPHWQLIKSRRIVGALLGVVIQAGGMFAFDTVLPLFVKDTFHWNATAAGLVFVCVMVPGFLAPVVGLWSDRYGAKWPSTVGFIASVPPLVCLRFVTDDSTGHKVLLCALLVLLGFTFTLCNTPLMAEISYAIDEKEAQCPGIWGEKSVYGIGYGLFTTAFALGGTVGSLMAGYLQAGPGWGTMTWALGLWIGAGAVMVGFMVGGKPAKPSAEPDSESTGGAGRDGVVVN
ncbi:MFS general substrate transporter [Thozetella sp. PMI_491]|nr:MFS general substrate transporter [Thozetella sp. PMI_491]